MSVIGDMLAELARPSTLPPDRLHGAYDRMVIGIGHAMVGAALVTLLPAAFGLGVTLRLTVTLAYWALKERGDLTRGGTLVDGLEDTALVGLGTWYGPAWWPWAVLAVGVYLFWRGARSA